MKHLSYIRHLRKYIPQFILKSNETPSTKLQQASKAAKAKKRTKKHIKGKRKKMDRLSGAVLYILQDQYDPALYDNVLTMMHRMGGTLATDLTEATHVLWIGPCSKSGSQQEVLKLEQDVLAAQELQIPIVDAMQWLQACYQLPPHSHWSDLDVTFFLPEQFMWLLHREKTATTTPKSSSPSTKHRRARSDPSGKLLPRRDLSIQMSRSLSQTFQYLVEQDPELLEENALKRAMELSLLDQALVVRSTSFRNYQSYAKTTTPAFPAYQILGLKETATLSQIKSAYRNLAKKTHPDKGGNANEFERVARAYRTLVQTSSMSGTSSFDDGEYNKQLHLKSTAHWDSELQDHRRLVEELFSSHGANLDQTVQAQRNVLSDLGLYVIDAGSQNINENDEMIQNSCFYLSLAASYLSGIGALFMGGDDGGDHDEDDPDNNYLKDDENNLYLIRETALQLKRVIEAAVVTAHPEWAAQGQVGEEVQAFSDFLVYLLDRKDTLLSDWAVVVFDSTSGVADIYKGKYYDDNANNTEQQQQQPKWLQSNAITIQYLPGHYQPLLPTNDDKRPCLSEILETLDKHGVLYVVTDGAA